MEDRGLEIMEPPKPQGKNPGIRLDIMKKIISDVDNHPILKEIFGVPVSNKLAIITVNKKLRLVENGVLELSDDQKQVFQSIIVNIINENKKLFGVD